MDVGVAELKARLSEHLDRAGQGERAERAELIRATERGRPKTLLSPLAVADGLEAGIADGWIEPGDGTPAERARGTRWSRSGAS